MDHSLVGQSSSARLSSALDQMSSTSPVINREKRSRTTTTTSRRPNCLHYNNHKSTERKQQQPSSASSRIITRNHHKHRATSQLVASNWWPTTTRMQLLLALVGFCFVGLFSEQQQRANGLVQAADLQTVLRNFSINPDVVQIPTYTETIRINLNNNEVKPGDRVPAKNFKDLKNDKISWSVSSLDARHTLILVDLDRKSPGVNQSQIYNQFTSLNMPGNDINLGQTIVAFEQPVVPCIQPSAKHRMLMLAFHQPNQIDMADVFNIAASSGNSEKRKNFDLKDFARKNQLTVVAANAFYAMAGDAQGICSGAMSSTLMHSVSWLHLLAVTMTGALAANSIYRHHSNQLA